VVSTPDGDDLVSPGYRDVDEQRWVTEPPKRTRRTAFARDRARLLHSSALRRLAAKTQVLVAGEADFPRTRLTHTLEVAQIGRELGLALGADPDLVEVACLAHDLGHPPYGHNGEDALHEAAAHIGGFEGNAQSLRVLTRLESKTFAPQGSLRAGGSVGLNLTRASLDAATKYPWPRTPGRRKFGAYDDDLDVFAWLRGDRADESTCIEAQIMDWSDDVAYCVHDVEDAVHAGLLDLTTLDSPDVRAEVAKTALRYYARDAEAAEIDEALIRLRAMPFWPTHYDGTHTSLAAMKNFTSSLIGRFSEAAQSATEERFGTATNGHRLTRYSATLEVPRRERIEVAAMKAIATRFVIQRDGAEVIYRKQRDLIAELVSALSAAGGDALDPWLHEDFAAAQDDAARLRVVIDQVASLTDHSVVVWHRRHCG